MVKGMVRNLNIKVLLWYDTEDYITPEADDALLALIEMMDARLIKGTFKIVGEKARVLKARERDDILTKLSGHEVGYHTDMHSVHPTVSEYLENYSFREGAYEFEKREIQGLMDLVDITGQYPTCYGQAGASWGPQTFPVLKKWGILNYLDVHDIITLDSKPFWYDGLLNLTALHGVIRMDLKEGGLEDAKARYNEIINTMPDAETGFVSIYYHPCEFSCTCFWDGVNFSRGENRPREKWKSATLRATGEMSLYIEQLSMFLDYILSKDNTEFITASQVFQYEKEVKAPFTSDDIKLIASMVNEQLNFIVFNKQALSVADQFSLFSRYLTGKLENLEPEFLYGPENDIDTSYNNKIKVSEVKAALNCEYPKLYDIRQLPDFFVAGGVNINPIDMTCTLAKIIREGLSDCDEVEIVKGSLKATDYVNQNVDWGNKWSIFPFDIKVPNIIKMAKLQAWTLKPALF